MRARAMVAALLIFSAYGCATTAPAPQPEQVLRGMASWYGEEFAGRTTANGEIFDPMLMTAAHRTLPFGTVVDVTNPTTSQSVRVRVNDRGPYVGNRVIDLSYAAAQQIGLIEPGTGEVIMTIVAIGKGDREPPAPYVVNIEEPKEKVVISPAEPPAVAFPLPTQVVTTGSEEDFRVAVVEEKQGVPTRRQVAADGKTIEEVPIEGAAPIPPSPRYSPAANLDRQRVPPPAPVKRSGKYVVQVGAFSVEANAKALQDRLTRIGQTAYVDREDLFRVRIGPFVTRDEAVRARTALEVNGMSAIIVTE